MFISSTVLYQIKKNVLLIAAGFFCCYPQFVFSNNLDVIQQSLGDLRVKVFAVESAVKKVEPVLDPLPLPLSQEFTGEGTETITVTSITETVTYELPAGVLTSLEHVQQSLATLPSPDQYDIKFSAQVIQPVGIDFNQRLKNYELLIIEVEQAGLLIEFVRKNKIKLENLKNRIVWLFDSFEVEQLKLLEKELRSQPDEPGYSIYREVIKEDLLPVFDTVRKLFDGKIVPYESVIKQYQEKTKVQIDLIKSELKSEQDTNTKAMIQQTGPYEDVSIDVERFVERGEAIRFALLNLEARKAGMIKPYEELENAKTEYEHLLSQHQLETSSLQDLASQIKHDKYDLCPLQKPLEDCTHEELRQQWVGEHNLLIQNYNQGIIELEEKQLALNEHRVNLEQEVQVFNSKKNELAMEQQTLLTEQSLWKSGEPAINARYKLANEFQAQSQLIEQLQLRLESVRY